LLDDEIYNVRAALTWALAHDAQVALLLTAALLGQSYGRGPLSEGRALTDQVLTLPGASAHTSARAKALLQAAHHQDSQGATLQAQAYAEESLAISQELGYIKGEADALLALGIIAQDDLHWDASRHYLEDALVRYRTLDDAGGIVHALAVLSQAALLERDYPLARALAEECLAVARQAAFIYPWPFGILANVACAEGDLDLARMLYEELLAAARPRNFKGTLLWALSELGSLATRQGDFTVAHARFDEAVVYVSGRGFQGIALPMNQAALAQAEGDHRRAVQLYRASLAGVKQDRWHWGFFLLGLAALAEAVGEYELIAKLLGATQMVDETTLRLFPSERQDFSHLVDAARARLSASRFDAAWAEGRELAFDQVAEEAVSIFEATLHILSPSW
jgi:tetratricopeptide (TPR) repeat protein